MTRRLIRMHRSRLNDGVSMDDSPDLHLYIQDLPQTWIDVFAVWGLRSLTTRHGSEEASATAQSCTSPGGVLATLDSTLLLLLMGVLRDFGLYENSGISRTVSDPVISC